VCINEPWLSTDDDHKGSYVKFTALVETGLLDVPLHDDILEVFDQMFEVLFLVVDFCIFVLLVLNFIISPLVFALKQIMLKMSYVSAHFDSFTLI
jgi:hypothetical protein